MIESASDLIAVITASATAITGILVAIRYSRCKKITCCGTTCERDLIDNQPSIQAQV